MAERPQNPRPMVRCAAGLDPDHRRCKRLEEANEFQRSIEREIGAGVGIPSFLLTHDMSQVNFSSARVAIQEFRRKVEQIQDHFAFQVLRPIYRKWLSAEILSGRIDARFDNEKIFQH